MASVKRARQKILKPNGETKTITVEFDEDLSSGEAVSAVDSTSVNLTHIGALSVDATSVSGTTALMRVSGGLAERTFTGDDSSDTLTSTGHGLSNGDTVHVIADGANSIGGLSQTTQYYVVNSATNTLQLALTAGGDAVTLSSDCQGTLGVDYWITVTVSTSSTHTFEGEVVVWCRD